MTGSDQDPFLSSGRKKRFLDSKERPRARTGNDPEPRSPPPKDACVGAPPSAAASLCCPVRHQAGRPLTSPGGSQSRAHARTGGCYPPLRRQKKLEPLRFRQAWRKLRYSPSFFLSPPAPLRVTSGGPIEEARTAPFPPGVAKTALFSLLLPFPTGAAARLRRGPREASCKTGGRPQGPPLLR